MSKQPALLNSGKKKIERIARNQAIIFEPGPSFKAAASSSSCAGLCRNLADMVVKNQGVM